MRRYWCVGVLGAVVLVLSGCFIIEIPPRPPIAVPAPLTPAEVETVLIYHLLGQPMPVEALQGERVDDQALRAFLMPQAQPAQTQRGWVLESVDPGLLTAGYQQGRHALRATIQIAQEGIMVRILDSKNLSQEGTRMHEVGLLWMEELESGLRRALAQAATVRRLGMQRR